MNHGLTRCFVIMFCMLHGSMLHADPADVVILGGTPGGIASSVATGRAGRAVTLVEYHDHVGGMMASGRGKSDIEKNPWSSQMLKGSWVPDDPHQIDFSSLPRVVSQHAVVSDVRPSNGVNQHNYLVHHVGRYWAMWSDGPGIEDRVGQRVKFARVRMA